MKKGIVLGAIEPFCDLVIEMEKVNVSPIICDYYEDAPAKWQGHHSYNISTMDIEKMIALGKFHDIDGVISAFSDRNLNTAYELAKSLKVPQMYNKKIIDLLTDKLYMKDFFEKIGVPVIKYKIIDKDVLQGDSIKMDFPVVTKPIDAYGSKGIFICDTQEEIQEVFDDTTIEALKYKNEIIVEEYYPVDEISITAWVKKGVPFITCIYDVIKNFDSTITLAAVSFPSKYTEQYIERFSVLLKYVVQSCGIQEGPVTLQCFIGEKGIKISELLFRLAGGSPYLYSTYIGGPNIAKMLIQMSVGDEVDYQNLETYRPTGIEEVYFDVQIFVKKKGNIYYKFDSEEIKRQIQECVDLKIYHQSGKQLVNVSETGRLFARAICKLDKRDDGEYYNLIKKLEEILKVYDEEGHCISFIRKPEKLGLSKITPINWSFMEKKGV